MEDIQVKPPVKPSDLRIGNILDVLNESGVISQDTGYNWMVVEILENGVNVRPFSEPTAPKEFYTFDRLSPITLTEEWLNRMSFKKGESSKRFRNELANESYLYGSAEFYMVNVRPQLQFVHQLQNVFYWNSGVDLVVNLNEK